MSREGFDAGWLGLREEADHRSRAVALRDRLEAFWSTKAERTVVDLGAGTGSNLRYLAPSLQSPQQWLLVDHDADLLAAALATSQAEVRVDTLCADLREMPLESLARADLVTASALLDLVSAAWLEALVDACVDASAAALFALTYDGSVEWSAVDPAAPPISDPVDALVLDALNRHQVGDKGFGAALGPAAGAAAESAFQERGYRTWLSESPWVLGRDDLALVEALVEGWTEAVGELLPHERARLEEWSERRLAGVAAGNHRVVVGHLDLLALPPDTAGS